MSYADRLMMEQPRKDFRIKSQKKVTDIKCSHEMQRRLAEYDSHARVQDLYQLFAFGLRSRQYMLNRIHLKEIVAASQTLKTAFCKLAVMWRQR